MERRQALSHDHYLAVEPMAGLLALELQVPEDNNANGNESSIEPKEARKRSGCALLSLS